MKKIWNRIVKTGKISIIEFIISVLTLFVCILLAILDFNGVIPLSLDKLICIVIIILGLLVSCNLLERFGILSSIHESVAMPDKSYAYFTTRRKYEHEHTIDDLFNDVTDIHIMAVANTSFLKGNGIMHLVNASNKGIKVKLLSINPNLDLATCYSDSKILSHVSIPLSENIDAFKRWRGRDRKFRANVRMKICNIIIPYSMIILKKNEQIKMVKIDLYTNNIEYHERRSVIIPSTDTKNLNFFLNQWKYMWDHKDNTEITD